MSPENDLELEGASLYPASRPIVYMDGAYLILKLRNHGDRVLVKFIECEFPPDGDLKAHVVRETVNAPIPRLHAETFQVPFTAELHLPSGTQQLTARVHYERGGVEKVATYQPGAVGAVWLVGVPRRKEKVFISHKDPEDTGLARQLKAYLSRAGFDAYIAEDLPRPGSWLWPEKLAPAVRDSLCVVVLWTERALASDGIKREMHLAEEHRKKIILAKKDGVATPDWFPKSMEYYPLDKTPGAREMSTLARVIWDMERKGSFHDGK